MVSTTDSDEEIRKREIQMDLLLSVINDGTKAEGVLWQLVVHHGFLWREMKPLVNDAWREWRKSQE